LNLLFTKFAPNSVSSSITSNNSFMSSNSVMSSAATISSYGRKISNFSSNSQPRRRSRGLSFNNTPTNTNSHNIIPNSKNLKILALHVQQNDEIFTIDDDKTSDDPKPPYPARLYALSSSSPSIYPIFKYNPSSNLSTPNQPSFSIQSQTQFQMTSIQASAPSSRKTSVDNYKDRIVVIIIFY